MSDPLIISSPTVLVVAPTGAQGPAGGGGGGGSGDVVGPASATDNALARFDGATGKLLQASTVTLSDVGQLAGVRSLTLTDGTNTVTLSVVVVNGRAELQIV